MSAITTPSPPHRVFLRSLRLLLLGLPHLKVRPLLILAVTTIFLGPTIAYSQDYPTKPVRIITGEAGGSTDVAARLIAHEVSGSLGRQVVVENRGGGGGVVPNDAVAKASPDGYTILVQTNSLWTLPLLKKVPYDPVRDFLPIALVGIAPSVLVVHPSLPVHSVKELIVLAKAKPGLLNYGSGGPGSPNQIAGELFKSLAGGLKIIEVPYKGGGPALIALVRGETHLMFASSAAAIPHIKTARLRALAVTSAERSDALPEIPTVASFGMHGYETATIMGFYAPAKTPAAIVSRLGEEIRRALATSDVKHKLSILGIRVIGGTSQDLAERVRSDTLMVEKVIKVAGIRVDSE